MQLQRGNSRIKSEIIIRIKIKRNMLKIINWTLIKVIKRKQLLNKWHTWWIYEII